MKVMPVSLPRGCHLRLKLNSAMILNSWPCSVMSLWAVNLSVLLAHRWAEVL